MPTEFDASADVEGIGIDIEANVEKGSSSGSLAFRAAGRGRRASRTGSFVD